ncbi:MAG TPA: hypothetical protein VFE23_16190 [Usitatibacter sp.]|jgi:hypothetical protein|nr:hypothetical protein [Usitatibacter sp.]
MRLIALASIVLCGLGLRIAHAATPFSVDASDLWYNPAESGWGVNLAQQGDTVFLTLYVYGSDNKPTWYVASGMQGQKTGAGPGEVSFSGDLYATTGPAFSGAFDPGAVATSRVGTATFDITGGTMGTLTYTVNGTRVVKQVVRQTWRENNAGGNYIGYLSGSCATTTTGPEESITFTITQSTPAFFMNTTGTTGVSCGYDGKYSQDGRLGHVEGTVSCTNGKTGTFVLDAIEASTDGLVTHLTTKVGTCTLTSRLAGIRR